MKGTPIALLLCLALCSCSTSSQRAGLAQAVPNIAEVQGAGDSATAAAALGSQTAARAQPERTYDYRILDRGRTGLESVFDDGKDTYLLFEDVPTIRLKARDALALEARAKARGMKPSSYLTHLVRSHLAADPPLPAQELAQIKRLIGELNGIRMALLRIAQLGGQGAYISEPISDSIQALLPGLKRIRNDVQAQLSANAKSWESGR